MKIVIMIQMNDKSKIKIMVKALIKIRDAEIIDLHYGLFDTLERCYACDTIEEANRTIKKKLKNIFKLMNL